MEKDQGTAIVIMAKKPVPGQVKTRLCPPLTPFQASALYEAFFHDTVALVSNIGGTKGFVAYDPKDAGDFFSRSLPRDMRCISQGSGDLGERLSRVSYSLFSQGYQKVLLIASDTPHMPKECFPSAISMLDAADMVLGPCEDGGYYLIGTRFHAPALFSDIPWSTSKVKAITINIAREQKMKYEILPSCYDIDNFQDVKRLFDDLYANKGAGASICPRTLQAFSDLQIDRNFGDPEGESDLS